MSNRDNIQQVHVPPASEVDAHQMIVLAEDGKKTDSPFAQIGSYVRSMLGAVVGRNTPRDMLDIMEHMYPGRGKDLEMEQSENVGDCYFVAALYGLKHNEIFEHLMRKMVKLDGENWIVQFPDGSAPITVSPEDLNGQKIHNEKTGRLIHRKPVKGGTGDRILERAYGRYVKENLQKVIQAKASEAVRTFAVLLKGGNPMDVFEAFLGRCVSQEMIYGAEQQTINRSQLDVLRVEQWLNAAAWNPDHIIITAGTPSDMITPYKQAGVREFLDRGEVYFMDKDHFFHQEHAYTITAVDAKKRLVTVVNPHDTGRLKKVTSYDEFMKIFLAVCITKLDPKAIKEELGVELPLWKGTGAGLHADSKPENRVEDDSLDGVESVLMMLNHADELTSYARAALYNLTSQEVTRIKQKYSAVITTAKFGGRNDPSEVRFAKEVVGCIKEIEALRRRAADDLDEVYRRIDDRD